MAGGRGGLLFAFEVDPLDVHLKIGFGSSS